MEFFQDIGKTILDSLSSLWDSLIDYLPSIIAAVIVLVVGILIARLIARIITRIIRALKVDHYVRKINIIKKIEESGTLIEVSAIIGWLVKWFLYIVILIAVSEILELSQFTVFLRDIALYIPHVIIAVLILLVGIILGDFADRVIVSILRPTKAKLATLVGAIAKWAIFIFAIFAALIQLGVAVSLIQTLFTAIMVAIALSVGLAFGIGGKEAAKEFIEKMRRDIRE